MLRRCIACVTFLLMAVACSSTDEPAAPATSACAHTQRAACASDTACGWCEGKTSCAQKAEVSTKPCDAPGEGEPCTRKGEMRCFGSRVYLCDGAALKGVYQCQATSTKDVCIESPDRGSVSCASALDSYAGAPSAIKGEPCPTDAAEACAAQSDDTLLACKGGVWTVSATCTSPQRCRGDASKKPGCR